QQEGLPRHGTPAERKSLFEDATRAGRWWGYFEDARLSATAGLNALYKHIGQVGGVYTVPERRGLGLSTATMTTLMADSVRVHGLRRLVLFTGDHNRAARRVYDRLGFATIGDFALLMCEPIE
ncbi:MAG TPA: GNAT family N-acetyltransferase, partial [Vicinamibacterales bacterium]|nr:GNAT family N-acetyltransferase [Vicinamibacterales bacterium]